MIDIENFSVSYFNAFYMIYDSFFYPNFKKHCHQIALKATINAWIIDASNIRWSVMEKMIAGITLMKLSDVMVGGCKSFYLKISK